MAEKTTKPAANWPQWPQDNAPVMLTPTPNGGFVLQRHSNRLDIRPELEAAFTTPSDAILYMIDQLGPQNLAPLYDKMAALRLVPSREELADIWPGRCYRSAAAHAAAATVCVTSADMARTYSEAKAGTDDAAAADSFRALFDRP